MENREQQILSEIKSMMASIRSQLELLDAKMAELQLTVGADVTEVEPIDLNIDDLVVEVASVDIVDNQLDNQSGDESETSMEILEETVVEVAVEEEMDDDLPFDDLPETSGIAEAAAPSEAATLAEVAVLAEEEVEKELSVEARADEEKLEPEPEEEESEPEEEIPMFSEPEPVYQTVSDVAKPKQAVIDAMADRQAWRTDMPGTPVKDIRSAISLNDRILFINTLFRQDPVPFQDALTKINQMSSIDEVVAYISEEQQDWDLGSDIVYRFMMAVRRKVR